MVSAYIFWILTISYTTADHGQDVLPTFTWDLESRESETVNLVIDFHDGDQPDVAILNRIHSQFGEDAEDEEDDEWTLMGYLRDEPEVPVTVDGFPGKDTFQVIFNSQRVHDSTFMVRNGEVTAHHQDKHQRSGSDDAVIIFNDEELPEKFRNIGDRAISEQSLPSSFKVTLALSYDNLFLNNVCGGKHATAKQRVEKIVNLAQTYFLDSATLGTKITLEVKEIKHTNNEFKLRSGGVACDANCMLTNAGNEVASQNPIDVDNYHVFSADNPGPGVWDTAGIARAVGYTINGVTWAVQGSVCIDTKQYRVGITEFFGNPSDWESGKLNAALTFAHELGHSLGMPHDFDGSDINNPRSDSSGTSCLNVDGIMSYKNTKTTWSTCSKEAITGWFNQLTAAGLNCKSASKPKCENTWNNDCDKYKWACTSAQYPWFKDECKKTCNICTA